MTASSGEHEKSDLLHEKVLRHVMLNPYELRSPISVINELNLYCSPDTGILQLIFLLAICS